MIVVKADMQRYPWRKSNLKSGIAENVGKRREICQPDISDRKEAAADQKPDKDGANFEGTLSENFQKISYLPKLSVAKVGP